MLLAPNAILGNFRILKPLGSDTLFEDYLAEHCFLHTTCHVRILTHPTLSVPNVIERIQQELAAFSQLSHPSIPVFYTADVVDQLFFYTLEYREGRPLSDCFAHEKITSVEKFATLFRMIVDLLHYLQTKSISAERLTPGDILLNQEQIVITKINLFASVPELPVLLDNALREILQQQTGLFFLRDSFHSFANIHQLGRWMFETVATGTLEDAEANSQREKETYFRRKPKKDEPLPRLIPAVDQRIESLILKTGRDRYSGGFGSLREVMGALNQLVSPKPAVEEELPASAELTETPIWDFQPSIEAPAPTLPRREHKTLWKVIIMAVAVLAICAGIGIGLLSVLPALRATNIAPTARATATSNFVKLHAEVELDGTASSDPDNDKLSYYWEVVSPADAKVLFSQNKTREAGKIRAAFVSHGVVKIQLRVFDGSNFSSPVYVLVNVY